MPGPPSGCWLWPAAHKKIALLSAADALDALQTTFLLKMKKICPQAGETACPDALLDRLALSRARIAAMADGMRSVAALPDPVGLVLEEFDRPQRSAPDQAHRTHRRDRCDL